MRNVHGTFEAVQKGWGRKLAALTAVAAAALLTAARTAPAQLRVEAVEEGEGWQDVTGHSDADADVFVVGPGHVQAHVQAHVKSMADDGHAIEVTLDDGDLTVRLDGHELSADRIRFEDGRVIILDENGDEIETIEIGAGGGGGVGAGGTFKWFGQPGEPAEEPKVMLGIHLGTPGPALERHLKLEPGTTTMILALYEGLPAHDAGLSQYDIIVAIDGKMPADPASLQAALAKKQPGESVRLTVIQAGEKRDVQVSLRAYDREAMTDAKLIGETGGFAFHGANLPRIRIDGLDDLLENIDVGQMVPRLDTIFIAPDARIFEASPRLRMKLHHEAQEMDDAESEHLDGDLAEIDRRLKELEKLLQEVLKEAE